MYSIKKVSELLDIPTVTIRAWEGRYQMITPIRSKGGHRLYSEEDINTLKWVKSQMEEKDMKVSEVAMLLKKKKMQLLQKHDIQKTNSRVNYDKVIESLYVELTQLNTAKSHKIIDLAFALFHYEDVFHDIITPVLYRIGDEWEKGQITVSQEHFSTQVLMERCTRFLDTLPVQPHSPKALALCPEGEHHHMGLLLFSLFLRKKGLDVTYLGPNTPLADLSKVIKIKNINFVALSITDPRYLDKVTKWMDSHKREHSQMQFILGGAGVTNDHSDKFYHVLSGDKEDWENWFQTVVVEKFLV